VSLHRDTQGFFPLQDTGVIQGISQAPATISAQQWQCVNSSLRKRSWKILRSRASPPFIGADGTNTTLNQRPHVDHLNRWRSAMAAPRCHRAAGPRLAQVDGIQLFLEPVQNITVDDASVAVIPIHVEDPDPTAHIWASLVIDCASFPRSPTFATTTSSRVAWRSTWSSIGSPPPAWDSARDDRQHA